MARQSTPATRDRDPCRAFELAVALLPMPPKRKCRASWIGHVAGPGMDPLRDCWLGGLGFWCSAPACGPCIAL